MSKRVPVLLIAVLVGALIGWFALRREPTPITTPPRSTTPATHANTPAPATLEPSAAPTSAPAPTLAPAADEPPEILARLNASDGSVREDLRVLGNLFEMWQSNFPRDGNPVGDNPEITTALTGRNRLELVLIPRDHPAINRAGELCDRWGTPYFFHQISGAQMEIRSAGPDKKLHTTDDELLTP